MMDVLNSYLAQNQRINIPGMGTLYLETIPAQTDFANRQLLPPSFKYRFDKYFDAPDKAFFSFLAGKKNIPDYEAIKWYNEFAYDLRNTLRLEDKAEWEGIGYFVMDGSGEINFEPYAEPYTLFKPVKAERVIRTDRMHSITVGDRERTNVEMAELLGETQVERESWWLYALIIAAVAFCAIFFHYYNRHASAEGISSGNGRPALVIPDK